MRLCSLFSHLKLFFGLFCFDGLESKAMYDVKPITEHTVRAVKDHISALCSSLVFFFGSCFLPLCRRWRQHSWQKTWRCSWSTRRPNWRRSRSLWLRTAPPGRGKAATLNEHRYAASHYWGYHSKSAFVAPKVLIYLHLVSVKMFSCRTNNPSPLAPPGGSVQAETEAGEAEEGGGVLWCRWDPTGGDKSVQGEGKHLLF